MQNNLVTYDTLKHSARRSIEEPLQMHTGYVLDFSNSTIEEYFQDNFQIEFYHDKYSGNGPSKAKYLRAILSLHEPKMSARILRSLWEYRSTLPKQYHAEEPDAEDEIRRKYFSAVELLDAGEALASTDALEVFEPTETLSELISAIERDIIADKPAAALDRLHTYCNMKFRHLLEKSGIECSKDEPLHSRVGKYAKSVEATGKFSPMTVLILKSSINIFEKFNAVRNDQSLAHDNHLVEAREARFIFDSISSVLRFIKGRDQKAFGE